MISFTDCNKSDVSSKASFECKEIDVVAVVIVVVYDDSSQLYVCDAKLGIKCCLENENSWVSEHFMYLYLVYDKSSIELFKFESKLEVDDLEIGVRFSGDWLQGLVQSIVHNEFSSVFIDPQLPHKLVEWIEGYILDCSFETLQELLSFFLGGNGGADSKLKSQLKTESS